jgi:DNA-binding transcriptional ArsR family regulator
LRAQRILIEFVRRNDEVLAGLTQPHAFALNVGRFSTLSNHPHRCADILAGVPDPSSHAHLRADEPLAASEAEAIAELMQALAAPSRVRLLYALREGEAGVGELAERADVTASAASQQLRILRHLRFVATRREGRAVLYRLHDGHVAALLDEVRNHLDHAALGWTAPVAQRTASA